MGALEAVQRKPTAAELEQLFLQLLDDERFQAVGPWELNDQGEIVVSPVTGRHNDTQTTLAAELKRQLGGKAWGEQGIRRPDGAPMVPDVMWSERAFFIAHQDHGLLPNAPPLCVEVMSISNSLDQLRAKCKTYLTLGAIEAWIIEPTTQTVEIHDANGIAAVTQFKFDFAPFWVAL